MSVLYQTLEDRDNVDYVEANGPFQCDIKDRWLGKGYYYWDTFINSAHFWGYVSYRKYNKDYIIAKSVVTLHPDRTLNLIESDDLQKFTSWINEYELTYPEKEVTIERVITHIQNVMGKTFPYTAIKALFIDSINRAEYQDRIYPNGKAYLDLQPPIQVCIINKSIIGQDNFKVVYPVNYSDSEAYTF